jgi:hypothetical protein
VTGDVLTAGHAVDAAWTDVMNAAYERLIEPVVRHEGTVARLMGDAILAFFGAPTAHEDDPQRAVMAGLEIVSASRRSASRSRANTVSISTCASGSTPARSSWGRSGPSFARSTRRWATR